MNLFFVCLSSAVAALAIASEVPAAGADVGVLFDRRINLNEEETKQLQADPRRLSGQNAAPCNEKSAAEKPSVTATFSETKLQASFTCGAAYNTGLIPAFTQNTTSKCCVDGKETNQEDEIQTVLGVKGKAVQENQKVTVTLEKIPDDKRGKIIYYKCKKDEGNVCLVALELPAAIDKYDCAIDKVITLTLNKTAPSASFKCDNGNLTQTPFEVTNGKCSTVEKETTAVKLSTSAGGEFKVTAGQLPNQTEQLCYTCTYAQVPSLQDNHSEDRTCSVIVTVEAPASSTSTVTTTSSARSIVTACGALNIVIAMVLTVGAFN